MDKIELIQTLIDMLNELPYGDDDKLDKLLRRARMVIEKVFGSSSKYSEDLEKIAFYPRSRRHVSEERFRRIWNSGKGMLLNLCDIMIEDLQLSAMSSKEQTAPRVDVKLPSKDFIDLFFHGAHPRVKNVSEKLFRDGYYSQAIFEAFKVVNNYVKEKSGRNDLDGKSLMDEAFKFKEKDGQIIEKPLLQLNELQSQSDKDEQRGFQFLFGGAMQGIRNPKAHDIVVQTDYFKTLEYLAFASLLAKRVDETKRNP